MSKFKDKVKKSNFYADIICYNCGYAVKDSSIRYCPKCKVILNPNDLKWRKSFFIFLLLLLLIPLIFVILVLL